MRRIPISVQLYSVREEAARDFPAVLKRIADIGYAGVEFAGLHGLPPAEVRRLIDRLGLVASSSHGPFPTQANIAEIAATAQTLGYTHHVSGFGPDRFKTREEVLKVAAECQQAAALCKAHGLTFCYHNHWWEFENRFDGITAHELMMRQAPDLLAQLDTYWVKTGGASPADLVRAYGARAPLLHIKDGPCDTKQAMTAVGAGTIDWAGVLGACPDATEWLIVELDRCDTDMMDAVAASYSYLVSQGYAKGRI